MLVSGLNGSKRVHIGQPNYFCLFGSLLDHFRHKLFFAPITQSAVWRRCFGAKNQFPYPRAAGGYDKYTNIKGECSRKWQWPLPSIIRLSSKTLTIADNNLIIIAQHKPPPLLDQIALQGKGQQGEQVGAKQGKITKYQEQGGATTCEERGGEHQEEEGGGRTEKEREWETSDLPSLRWKNISQAKKKHLSGGTH